jgi:hypothetical protein
MFAGVHKHSQSRHAAAEGIETVDKITGEIEGGRGTTARWKWRWKSNKSRR